MTFAAAAVVFLLPLLLAPGVMFYYDITPKVALLMAGAAAGLVLAAKDLESLVEFWKRARMFCIAVAGSLVMAGVATWLSAERELAWFGSNWRRMGALHGVGRIARGVVDRRMDGSVGAERRGAAARSLRSGLGGGALRNRAVFRMGFDFAAQRI